VLADHGWLKVLDPTYAEGIRQAFREAFPTRRRVRERPMKPPPPPPPPIRQPGLFDRVG
jgi:hypothetical protein